MAVVRGAALVDAPLWTVAGALRHTRTAERGLLSLGVRGRAVSDAGVLLAPGDEMAFSLPWPGSRGTVRTRIVRADAEAVNSTLVTGPLPELRHESTLIAVGRRTRVVEVLHWTTPFGLLGRYAETMLLRRAARAILARRLRAVRQLARSWADCPAVVGAAIVHNGRLLAQQRRYPAQDAGRWELPGGRVERGEGEAEALIRECWEELAVEVVPAGRVGTDVPLRNGMVLRVYAAELVDPEAAPRAVEHRELRWLGAGELSAMDWLDADRVLVHSLHGLLAG